MPFKFLWNYFPTESLRVVQRLMLVVSLFGGGAVSEAQTLDWWSDMTVFGTTANERQPLLIISPFGTRLRLLCERSDSILCSKTSNDNGSSWSISSDSVFSFGKFRLKGAADAIYHYILYGAAASPMKTLCRLEHNTNDFHSSYTTAIAPDRNGRVHGFDIQTDRVYRPENPNLNVVWMEDASPGIRALYFTQSQTQAASFLPEVEIARFAAAGGSDTTVSLCTAWHLNRAYLLAAIAVDRPGSSAEEIRIFRSTDNGNTWVSAANVDVTTFPQTQPSLAAFGTTVLLAYTYGALPSSRDIRFAFSLDGGATFSAPQVIAGSENNEYSPQVLIDNSGQTFCLVYLTNQPNADSATVMVYSGLVAAPWQNGVAAAISDHETAVGDGGFSAAVGERGVAVAWTSRFISGDLDIRFDSIWRGNSTDEEQTETPTRVALLDVYPNPFNLTTSVRLSAPHSSPIVLTVTDLLGRTIHRSDYGIYQTGEWIIPLDFSGLSSGTYFIRLDKSVLPAQRILLLR